ncbi:MAG: S8 family serine peptidase [Pseudomonadota bacterium]
MTVIAPHLQWLYDDTPPHARAVTRVPVVFEWDGDLDVLVAFGMRLYATTGGIISADMPLSKLPEIHELRIQSLEMSRRTYPTLDVSRVDIEADQLQPVIGAETGKGVIIGIVDTGIDYTHMSFRNTDGTTRLLYVWDQRLTLVPSRPGKPRYPGERLPDLTDRVYQWGVEYTQRAINDALAVGGRPLRTRDTTEAHGSHVMGIAAGNGRDKIGKPATAYVGIAPAADLIVVATDFVHPKKDFTGIRTGVEYILARAKQLGRPCVVNLSLGSPLGARDGLGLEEKAIDALLTEKGRAIVIACGNDANKQRHVKGQVPPGAKETFTFKVDSKQTDERIDIEIWYGLKSVAERFDIEIRDPTGAAIQLAAPAAGAAPPTERRGTLGSAAVSVSSSADLPRHAKNRIVIDIQRDSRLHPIAAGSWSITLTGKVVGTGAQAGTYHGYLAAHGNPKASPTIFTAKVSPANTVTIPSTATKAIAVGSFVTKPPADKHKLSEFSSQGPTLDERTLPLLCAAGQKIMSVKAFDPKDTTGQTFVEKSGTSMAAPHVAGTVAGMLQVKPALKPDAIAQILGVQANTPTAPAPNTWGHGRVDALNAVTAAKSAVTS